jgi:16S rRNA (guanine527-N7)-methyltransferase
MISEDKAKQILLNDLNVSRETMLDLDKMVGLLKKWNTTINLVGRTSIEEVWARHVLDSAQMWAQRPQNLKTWVDLGSGGGFPALVLAILAKTEAPSVSFHLIESDARKCAYLRNVSRETSLNVKIHTNRIEEITPISADVVSARALAQVESLLGYSHKFLSKDAFCLFLKGKCCDKEVEMARESWRFQSEKIKSRSDEAGSILKVWNIKRA